MQVLCCILACACNSDPAIASIVNNCYAAIPVQGSPLAAIAASVDCIKRLEHQLSFMHNTYDK